MVGTLPVAIDTVVYLYRASGARVGLMSPSPKHFCGAHQIRRSVPVMAAPVMVLELMLRQAAAAIDKAGGYRACAYSPLAQPSLVGSTCTVGEPAPPATP